MKEIDDFSDDNFRKLLADSGADSVEVFAEIGGVNRRIAVVSEVDGKIVARPSRPSREARRAGKTQPNPGK